MEVRLGLAGGAHAAAAIPPRGGPGSSCSSTARSPASRAAAASGDAGLTPRGPFIALGAAPPGRGHDPRRPGRALRELGALPPRCAACSQRLLIPSRSPTPHPGLGGHPRRRGGWSPGVESSPRWEGEGASIHPGPRRRTCACGGRGGGGRPSPSLRTWATGPSESSRTSDPHFMAPRRLEPAASPCLRACFLRFSLRIVPYVFPPLSLSSHWFLPRIPFLYRFHGPQVTFP